MFKLNLVICNSIIFAVLIPFGDRLLKYIPDPFDFEKIGAVAANIIAERTKANDKSKSHVSQRVSQSVCTVWKRTVFGWHWASTYQNVKVKRKQILKFNFVLGHGMLHQVSSVNSLTCWILIIVNLEENQTSSSSFSHHVFTSFVHSGKTCCNWC